MVAEKEAEDQWIVTMLKVETLLTLTQETFNHLY